MCVTQCVSLLTDGVSVQDCSDVVYLKQLVLGPMANCVYLVGCPTQRECLVVDPAWEIARIIAEAEHDGMRIVGILATHFHPDHIGGRLWGYDIPGIADLLEQQAMPVYAHPLEVDGIKKVTAVSTRDIKTCDSGDRITVGNISITTIHTPGHTPGSQCFCVENSLISGDTLFISGCGRVDLPGGDAEQLYDSLHNKIKKLPAETIVLPGHHYDADKSAALGQLQTTNPYLRAKSRTQFMSVLCG